VKTPQRGGPIVAALLAAALTLVAGCGAPAVGAGSASPARSTDGPGTAAPPAAAAPVTADLPVVRCPTSLGAAHPAVSLPRSRPVPVPRALAARLSVYADDQGIMALVGPKGWHCAAFYGADGSGGIVVYPSGQAVPRFWTAGWRLTRTSAVVAITGSESSACYGCTLAQACPLFAAAARAWRSAFGSACPARPAAETVVSIGAGIVAFEDPPGVEGDGLPSGGRYSADGVLTYHPDAPDGSWRETCTLPGSDKPECTAVLDTFVSWYGRR
jgi:hypothetical protein